MDERDLQWSEREDFRHAYHRTLIEMAQMQKRVRITGKVPVWFLEDDDDWTPVAMDAVFWRMVAGGLRGLRRYLHCADLLAREE